MLKPTRADKILIACLFAANLALFSGIDYTRTAGDWVVIEVSQKEVKRLPLKVNQLVHVEGPLGETEVQIQDGKARILKSPCSRKLCIKSGYIHYADRIAACLPNRVVVRILGSTYRGIDAVVS
ncbi:conserved exported hypothetical protein [Nitrospina gracilis 3/211]|uniref:Uncharacterized protein n=1 Tax=Nitrospina gracilis (strain 3/211) TaxID=1266370 RepID=M1YKD6_NITG3|nr:MULTISPECIES: NusG domain II-containing protein [Nitrospina]MCF8723829.1 hypothetical protein [Nitrospina sp. Nb-3]CCQ90947.1 conserved exported hypothetical protein [Nitrospina gracilis 3/211]